LHIRVEGGMDRGGSGSESRKVASRPDLPGHIVTEIGSRLILRPFITSEHRQCRGGLGLLRGDLAILLHAAEHVAQALVRTIRMTVRAEIVRAFCKCSEQGALA